METCCGAMGPTLVNMPKFEFSILTLNAQNAIIIQRVYRRWRKRKVQQMINIFTTNDSQRSQESLMISKILNLHSLTILQEMLQNVIVSKASIQLLSVLLYSGLVALITKNMLISQTTLKKIQIYHIQALFTLRWYNICRIMEAVYARQENQMDITLQLVHSTYIRRQIFIYQLIQKFLLKMWNKATSLFQTVTNTYENTQGYEQIQNYVKRVQIVDEETQNNNGEQDDIPNEKKVFNPDEWNREKFEFGRYLGTGAFGHVYLARERKSKFILALKVISKRQLQLHDLMHCLTREIEILTHLKHPNIISFYGFFQNEKRVHLMLEWAPKGDLFGLMKQQPNRRFTEKQASNIIRQITYAIGYMHIMNVIHRDLKPGNILCFENDVFKISDFGWSVHTPSNKRRTQCGTLQYFCPEMINNQTHDNKVDIWTIGVLAYELVIGETPFESQSEAITIRRIENIIYSFPDWCSSTFKNFIWGILQHDCNQRPTIEEILQHPWLN